MSDKDNSNQISKQELDAYDNYDDYKESFFDSYKTSRLMSNIDIKNTISTFNDASKENILAYIDVVFEGSLPDSVLDELKASVAKILDVQHAGIDDTINSVIDTADKKEDLALSKIEFLDKEVKLLLSQIQSSVEKRSEYYQLEADEAKSASEDELKKLEVTGGLLNSIFKFTLMLFTAILAPMFLGLGASVAANITWYLNTNDAVYLYWSIFLLTTCLISLAVLFIGVNKLFKKHHYFLGRISDLSIDRLTQSTTTATKRVDKINELVGELKGSDHQP